MSWLRKSKPPQRPHPPEYYEALATATLKVFDALADSTPDLISRPRPRTLSRSRQSMNEEALALLASASRGEHLAMPQEISVSADKYRWTAPCAVMLTTAEAQTVNDLWTVIQPTLHEAYGNRVELFAGRVSQGPKITQSADNESHYEFTLPLETEYDPEALLHMLRANREETERIIRQKCRTLSDIDHNKSTARITKF